MLLSVLLFSDQSSQIYVCVRMCVTGGRVKTGGARTLDQFWLSVTPAPSCSPVLVTPPNYLARIRAREGRGGESLGVPVGESSKSVFVLSTVVRSSKKQRVFPFAPTVESLRGTQAPHTTAGVRPHHGFAINSLN